MNPHIELSTSHHLEQLFRILLKFFPRVYIVEKGRSGDPHILGRKAPADRMQSVP